MCGWILWRSKLIFESQVIGRSLQVIGAMTWESYFASVADPNLTYDVGPVQTLRTFNSLAFQTFLKVIGCYTAILHRFSKKNRHFLESSVCWNLLRFWKKNARWTFFFTKLKHMIYRHSLITIRLCFATQKLVLENENDFKLWIWGVTPK